MGTRTSLAASPGFYETFTASQIAAIGARAHMERVARHAGDFGHGRVRLANGLAVGRWGWAPAPATPSTFWTAKGSTREEKHSVEVKMREGAARRWSTALGIRISLEDEGGHLAACALFCTACQAERP